MLFKTTIYPHFEVENNKKPNRVYAFPIFGLLLKLIILIPVSIEYFFLSLASIFVFVINSFVILFTGKYWGDAYRFFLALMRFETKISLFVYGLTDKYPGFSLGTDGLFKLDIEKPVNPNKWLNFPLFGFLVKLALLLPYIIFGSALCNGSFIALVISWFTGTCKKPYPKSLYEFERDTLRVSNATSVYLLGLKDNYPSFYISMDHQTEKILLIIFGALMMSS